MFRNRVCRSHRGFEVFCPECQGLVAHCGELPAEVDEQIRKKAVEAKVRAQRNMGLGLNVIIMDQCEQCEEKTPDQGAKKKRLKRELEWICAAEKAGESYDTFLCFFGKV